MSKKASLNSIVELPYLETFSQAAEQRSFTAAGKSLGLTQAAVSQRIHALEAMLGKSLFQRSGTRIQLTDSGQKLYEFAQQIRATHRAAFESISGRRTSVRGELILASSSIPGQHFLPEMLSAFREKYSEIRVRVTIFDSLAAIQAVENGTAHLGFVGRKIDSMRLKFRPFATDEIVVVVAADHPWQKRRTISFNQFARQPLILREPGSGSRWCFEQALADSGRRLSQFNVALELGGNEAIKETVLEGMGVALLSSFAVQRECETGQLHALRITGFPLKRLLYLVFDAERALPIPARMFLQFAESFPTDKRRL